METKKEETNKILINNINNKNKSNQFTSVFCSVVVVTRPPITLTNPPPIAVGNIPNPLLIAVMACRPDEIFFTPYQIIIH